MKRFAAPLVGAAGTFNEDHHGLPLGINVLRVHTARSRKDETSNGRQHKLKS